MKHDKCLLCCNKHEWKTGKIKELKPEQIGDYVLCQDCKWQLERLGENSLAYLSDTNNALKIKLKEIEKQVYRLCEKV